MADIPALIESVCKPNSNVEDQRTLLLAFYNQLNLVNNANGLNWLNPTSGAQKSATTPPPQAGIKVTGANGLYVVQITNPSLAANATIYHEVSYSPVKNFGQNVTTEPISAATGMVVPSPGQTLFFRLRSSFDRTSWNAYQYAQTTAVQSGLQSSQATENNVALNISNFASVDSAALGTMAAVRVYGTGGLYHSYQAVKGVSTGTRPSATIINVPFGSNQIVAYDGKQFRLAPILPGVFQDNWEPVGKVSVVGSGTPTLPTIDPIISGGQVIGFNVTDGGAGLTGPVTLAFGSVGGGTGATFGAQTIVAGVLISIAPGNPGSSYSGGTTVTATGGGVSPGAAGGGTAAGGNGGRLTSI